jgi:Trp operon repressor
MGSTTVYRRKRRPDKLPNKVRVELILDLIESFEIARDDKKLIVLLQFLLTFTEIRNSSVRLRIAKLLLQNNTQRDVAEMTRTSIATVNKVSIWLKSSEDSLKDIILALPSGYDLPKNLPKKPLEFQLPQTLYALYKYSRQKGASKSKGKVKKLVDELNKKKLTDKMLKEAYTDYYKKAKKKS